ncbi:hypothetical protein BJ742DRAFT_71001 [Cladochytrium replicatum]|nr:hypothetical protein BJ742DRAFT_71001 [Cladochytrium replicatum]
MSLNYDWNPLAPSRSQTIHDGLRICLAHRFSGAHRLTSKDRAQLGHLCALNTQWYKILGPLLYDHPVFGSGRYSAIRAFCLFLEIGLKRKQMVEKGYGSVFAHYRPSPFEFVRTIDVRDVEESLYQEVPETWLHDLGSICPELEALVIGQATFFTDTNIRSAVVASKSLTSAAKFKYGGATSSSSSSSIFFPRLTTADLSGANNISPNSFKLFLGLIPKTLLLVDISFSSPLKLFGASLVLEIAHHCTSLQALHIGGMTFDNGQQLASAIQILPILTTLDIRSCNFLTDSIVQSLLASTWMDTNTSLPPPFSAEADSNLPPEYFDTIETLIASENFHITDTSLRTIAHSARTAFIRNLDLSRCPKIRLDPSILALLRNGLTYLESLSLDHPNVTSSDPRPWADPIGDLPNLQRLTFTAIRESHSALFVARVVFRMLTRKNAGNANVRKVVRLVRETYESDFIVTDMYAVVRENVRASQQSGRQLRGREELVRVIQEMKKNENGNAFVDVGEREERMWKEASELFRDTVVNDASVDEMRGMVRTVAPGAWKSMFGINLYMNED